MSMKDILTKISLLESKQSKEPVVENWTDFEDAKKAHEQFGGKVTGRPDDYTVTTKDGERRRYITKDGKRKIERLPPVAASHDDDDEDSKPKKEVKVKKDKKEVEPAEGAKRRGRPPGSKNKKKISEMTDAEWHLVMRRVAVMERTLSEPEKKKKEDIAKSMKDSPEKIADLKKRYGKRWKEVVYATATKKAKDLKEDQGVEEGFPHDVDHMPGKTIKHQSTNCTTCHGRKTMYKLDGKLFADNKKGATLVKCPTCKGTGDKQGVAEDKGSKPDFLDVDKDGDRKESFKKAVKDKETIKEGGMAFQVGDYVYFGSQEGTIERFDGNVAIIQKRNGDLTAATIKELSSEKPGMMKKAASWMVGDSLQEEEVDEGILGALAGGAAGLALGGPVGGIIGAGLGQKATEGGSSLIEDDVEEGNEFSGELAKAKAAGQKEFEVDGKTYPVKEDQLEECGGDMSYGPGMQNQMDKVNVNANMSSDGNKTLNVTAEGDAATELAQLLKLSGMLGGDKVMSKDAVVDEEYANEPEEKVAGVAAVTKSGTDLHRAKQSYSDRPYRGDNPMLESLEQKLWAEFQKAKQK